METYAFGRAKPNTEHAQLLVYSLIGLMPSPYQKASLQAMLGLFLGEAGHALPADTQVKSPRALSRFLNHYSWSTRAVIRAVRRRVSQQLLRYCPRQDQPLLVLIDLTSLEKCGLFPHLGTSDNRWVRWLNHKRGGQQVHLQGMPFPVTVSWFWLRQQGGKRELRFVMSTHPYSGAYLVQLGRKRWAIEGFFKTIKHRFGWHCFGQSTRLGVYRWLVLALIAYLLAFWMFCDCGEQSLDWKHLSQLALQKLLPAFLWLKLLNDIHKHNDIATQLGFKISINPLNHITLESCKI